MELNLKIIADGSQAKQELAAVEKSVQKVEQASAKTGTVTSKALQAIGADAGKVNTATQQLSKTTEALAGANLKAADSSGLSGKALTAYYAGLIKADAAVITAAANQKVLAEKTVASAVASTGLLSSTNLLTGAFALAGAGLLALVGIVGNSVRFYLENAKSMEGNRQEIGRLQEAWEAFQFIVGQSVVGRTSIAGPVTLFSGLLVVMGVELANRISQARVLLELMARMLGVDTTGTQGPDPGRLGTPLYPDPTFTARGRMEGNKQYQRDQLEDERARIALAEEQFQAAKRAEARHVQQLREEARHIEAMRRFAGWTPLLEDRPSPSLLLSPVPGLATTMSPATLAALEQRTWAQMISGRSIGWMGYPAGAGMAPELMLPPMPWATKLSAATLGQPAVQGPGFFQNAFGSSAQFGGSLASTIMAAISGGGSVSQSVGGLLGSGLGGGLAKMLTGGTMPLIGNKLFGGVLNSILPGIGALAGPLLGKLTGWVGGLFKKDEGRQEVEAFGDKFGGLNQLHTLLGEQLPSDAERLWVALTQSKGAAAKAAIDAVTHALQQQQQKHVDVAQAAVTSAQKEVDAQAKIIQEIESRKVESDQRIATLSKAIAQEAAEEEMGIIERQQREELAKEQEHRAKIQEELDAANKKQEENLSRLTEAMDRLAEALKRLTQQPWEIKINGAPPGTGDTSSEGAEGFAGGTHGRYLDFGRGTPVMLHGRERVMTEAEGRSGQPIVINLEAGVYAAQQIVVDALSRSYRRRYTVGAV